MSLDAAVSSLVQRLETVTARLESVERQLASGGGAAASSGASSESAGDPSTSVAEFDDLIRSHIVPLVNLTNQLGSDELKKMVSLFQNAVQAERDFLTIPASSKKPAATKAAAAQKKGTPKFELQDKKWVVEWQENNQNIQITETELRQTIYIYKCEKSVVQISGKVNSITLDGCKRVAVVFSDAVAQVELVNCNACEIQITGRVPSVAIDKCSGVQVYLSKNGLETEIVSSKSDSMNVLIPDPAGGVDPIEIAIPEQFKTTVAKGKLVTHAVEHV